MFNVYKKERIKERPIVIDNIYDNIPNSSLLLLTKYSNFEQSFFEKFGNEFWKNITKELFTNCLVNLLITGKIKTVYYLDRKSILFNLIKINSEGFNISSTEDMTSNNQDDILANNILAVLNRYHYETPEDLPSAIKLVIDSYIGTGETNRPEKKFFYEYLKIYSKKNNWLKLKEDRKCLGLILQFNVELDLNKEIELKESQKKIDSIKFQLRKNNVLFRNFLTYAEQVVNSDFNRRYPGD